MEGPLYTGFKDPFLDFKGNAVDFKSQDKFDKVFSITVTNASEDDQLVLLTPSIKPSDPLRVVRDGVIPYASGAVDLSATGSPNTIAAMLKYIEQNPSLVFKLKIKSNNAAQSAVALEFNTVDIFKTNPVNNRINLETFNNEYQQNDKITTVTQEFQLDALTELSIVIPAAGSTSTKTTFTFYFGVSLHLANALAQKRKNSL